MPAFAMHLDATIDVPGYGPIVVDIAWGGMFFVSADAAQFGIDIGPAGGAEIVRTSEAMRQFSNCLSPIQKIQPSQAQPLVNFLKRARPGRKDWGL